MTKLDCSTLVKTENETIKAPTTRTEPTTLDPATDKGASSIYTSSKSAAFEIIQCYT